MQSIKKILEKKTRQLAGKMITCKMCQGKQSWVSLEEGRWMCNCAECGYRGYLKLQSI